METLSYYERSWISPEQSKAPDGIVFEIRHGDDSYRLYRSLESVKSEHSWLCAPCNTGAWGDCWGRLCKLYKKYIDYTKRKGDFTEQDFYEVCGLITIFELVLGMSDYLPASVFPQFFTTAENDYRKWPWQIGYSSASAETARGDTMDKQYIEFLDKIDAYECRRKQHSDLDIVMWDDVSHAAGVLINSYGWTRDKLAAYWPNLFGGDENADRQ